MDRKQRRVSFALITVVIGILSLPLMGAKPAAQSCSGEQILFCIEEVFDDLEICRVERCVCDLLDRFEHECMVEAGCPPEQTGRVLEQMAWKELKENNCE